jgi:hypothetical protein
VSSYSLVTASVEGHPTRIGDKAETPFDSGEQPIAVTTPIQEKNDTIYHTQFCGPRNSEQGTEQAKELHHRF